MSESQVKSQPAFSETVWALVERELSGGRLVLDEIAHAFAREVRAAASVVCLNDSEAGRTDVVAVWSPDGYLKRQFEWFAMNGHLGEVVARQRTTVNVDATHLWRFDGDDLGVNEGWVAPVFGEGRYGIVCLLFDDGAPDLERVAAAAHDLGPFLPRMSALRDE